MSQSKDLRNPLTVRVGNSTCVLQGFNKAQLSQIRTLMSYVPASRARFGKARWGVPRKYLIDRRGEFPTGLLYILEEWVAKVGAPLKLVDLRIRPQTHQDGLQSILLPGLPLPYQEQQEAANACYSASRGIIVAPTGLGKSLIASLIIDALQVPTLLVVPSLSLKAQLTESLQRAFGVGMVGPLSPNGKRKFFVTVENVDALDPNKPSDGIDCVIIDEYHHSAAATYQKLNFKAWNGVYFKFGLTATPFRSRGEERLLLESVLSKVIYQIPYHTAVDKGYIVPMETYYIDIPPRPLKCKGGNFHVAYKECIIENETLNKTCVDMAAQLYEAKSSTLILVKQIEHGLILQKMLSDRGIDVPFIKGENDDNQQVLEDFNSQTTPVLIGTVGVLGEGVDSRPCEYVLLAGGGKSKNQYMQNVGRGFRRHGNKESCKVVMFRETSHKWFASHFKECCKHLRTEYGVAPTKLEL